MNNVRDRILSLGIRYDELKRQSKNISTIITGLESEIAFLANEKKELEETWEALRELLDKFSAESLGMLKELLNKGIKAIFHDRNYEIAIEISDSKLKKLKLTLVEYTEDGIVEVEFGSNSLLMTGGGVLTIISFIFQVFLIIMYGKRRFIAMDEALTNISSSYVEGFFRFMNYLNTEMGFVFLLVNHDPRFMPYFNRIYNVNRGNVTAIAISK